ncbi:MAG: aromatic-ring-hydroxylating dioxygenase subunit beta [Pseudomonadota bacterium]
MSAAISIYEAAEFLWREADLLDHRAYEDWLELWSPQGMYIVPTEYETDAFEDSLNYVFDDDQLRRQRVARLTSRYSISAASAARTVRTVSRFVAKGTSAGGLQLRAAQHLIEYRREITRTLAADLEVSLISDAGELKLARKVVRLINCDDALHGIGYLL